MNKYTKLAQIQQEAIEEMKAIYDRLEKAYQEAGVLPKERGAEDKEAN